MLSITSVYPSVHRKNIFVGSLEDKNIFRTKYCDVNISLLKKCGLLSTILCCYWWTEYLFVSQWMLRWRRDRVHKWSTVDRETFVNKHFRRSLSTMKIKLPKYFSVYKWSKFMLSSGHSNENKPGENLGVAVFGDHIVPALLLLSSLPCVHWGRQNFMTAKWAVLQWG